MDAEKILIHFMSAPGNISEDTQDEGEQKISEISACGDG